MGALILGIHSCQTSHKGQTQINVAIKDQKAEEKSVKEGSDYEAQAKQFSDTLSADAAEVARLERPRTAIDHAPSGPPSPGELVAQPVVVAPDPQDVALNEAYRKEIADLKTQLQTVTLESQSYKAANQASQSEVIALRAALALTNHHWAAGAVYGTDNTVGAYVTRDLGLVRVGLEVVRRPVLGGQTTLEAIGNIGWRF
jgi:hypothetical protein